MAILLNLNLIAAQAHTRRLYLVQRGNRKLCYSASVGHIYTPITHIITFRAVIFKYESNIGQFINRALKIVPLGA